MHQVWGYNAAGSSGYTKEIALFRNDAGELEFHIRPALAAPEIVIKLDRAAAHDLIWELTNP